MSGLTPDRDQCISEKDSSGTIRRFLCPSVWRRKGRPLSWRASPNLDYHKLAAPFVLILDDGQSTGRI